ncbi:MAG: DUF5131 family protein [Planctomycetota bacterium]
MRKPEQYWDVSFNPLVGCAPVSEGCEHCWARMLDKRFHGGQHFDGHGPYYKPEVLGKLRHWKKARKIFVCDMSDIGHPGVSPCARTEIREMMRESPQHTYLLLTKRPENLTGPMPDNWWLGATCEDQRRLDERVPELLKIQAKIRWLSLEPLLGPVHDHSNALFPGDPGMARGWCWADVDWVVVGRESGPGARPCRIEWVESAVEQCQAAEVAVWIKQLQIDGKCVRDILRFPKHLQIREYPKLIKE